MKQNYGAYNIQPQTSNSFPKKQELLTQLQRCSHQYHNAVAQDASLILHNYPNQFDPKVYTQNELGYTRSLLELKGDLQIKHKTQNYAIITTIIFPYIYPEAPCIIKIHNPDQNKFKINDYFVQGSVPDGSVYIKLSETNCWNSHKSIARVMLQLISELSSHFPFYDKNAAQPKTNYQYIEPAQNQSNQNQQSHGYQPPQQTYQYNQPQYNQNAQNQQQPNRSSLGAQPDQEQQLKFQCMTIIEAPAIQITQNIKKEKELGAKLLSTYREQEQKKNQVNILLEDMKKNIADSAMQEEQLSKFVEKNDGVVLSKETINNYLVEADPLSTQILDLLSEIQAYKETFHLISEKFKRGQGELDTTIRMTRQIAEMQFNSNLILQKCMKSNK